MTPPLSPAIRFVAVVLTWAVASPSLADDPRDALPISWSTAASVAAAVFDEGPGAASMLRESGERDAAALAPGRLAALRLELGQDVGVADAPSPLGETAAAIGLGWTLHDPGRIEAARARRGAVIGAARRLSRFQFIASVEEAYLAWWAASAVAEHLAEHRSEVAAALAPLEAAASKHLLTRLDLLDLRAELSRLASEVSLAEQSRSDAHAALESTLGARVRPTLDVVATLDRTPEGDPWQAVLDRIADHPALALGAVQADAAAAEAALADDDAPWALDVFVTTRHDGDGPTWLGAVLSLSLPLSRPRAADAVALRAEGRASSIDAAASVQRARASWAAAARRFEALRRYRRELNDGRLAVLKERQEALERAWEARQVPFDRVVRARHELHEAIHELYLVTAALLAEESRATALLHHLTHESTEAP